MRSPSQSMLRKKFLPYAKEIGNLTLAWNALHNELANIFWAVLRIENGNIPFAIWHSTPSDLSQRRMLRAAVKATYEIDSRELEDICWLLTQIDERLSVRRNDAIHAPLVFLIRETGISLEPYTFSGNPRAKALEGKALLSEFAWYVSTAECLAGFAMRLHVSLRFPAQHGWPSRPNMPLQDKTNEPKRTRVGRRKSS